MHRHDLWVQRVLASTATRAVGVVAPKACSDELSFLQSLFATDCDWENKALGWTFSLAIGFLGSSAAIFGHWLETAGPRKAGLGSACCWCGGLLISALGAYSHQIYLLWLGSGVIGGIGLGLGYISPVSTLMKWFPDRRGVISVPRRDGRLDRTKRCLDKVLLSIVGDSLSKRTSNLGGK